MPTAPATQQKPTQKINKKAKQRNSQPTNKKGVRREQKHLTKLRKVRTGKGLLQRLSPEARRFTVATRRRRAIFWTLFSSFGSLVLLVLATIFTPLLAVEKIEVVGLDRLQEKSIINAIKSQIGTPLPLVSPSDIADALDSFALIESFSVVSLPPHTLRIEIAERQPIGIINVSGTNFLYDPAGVRIAKATGSEQLPNIVIDDAPETSKQFKAAIDVLLALPAELLKRVAEIDAKSKDDVTLRLRGYAGQRIIWGDGSDSVLKSKVLDALIANQKETDRVTFDVSSPNAPVVRY